MLASLSGMTSRLSTGKKFALGLCTAALVLAAGFGVTELALRLSGYGHSPRFLRETEDAAGRRWLRENRWVTAPYFPPELARRPQPVRLPQPKAPGTYRIFVLGSSAAMGDPEPAFSIARVLDVMLREAYPNLSFEVVNAGITAINSHVVRAIAADCAGAEPDLFIVYEGNNEVIGPFGPATVFNAFGRSAAAIRMRQAVAGTRTGQGLAAAARRLRADDRALRDWGGMRMFLEHEIARDDPRLDATCDLFRANLSAIAQAGRRSGATVLLCTVLTNQKDFPPFLSRHRAGLTAADAQAWAQHFTAGQRAAAGGDDVAAEREFRAALAIDDRYAELHFQLGRLCLRGKRAADAATFFQQALDLDVLRFRTDSRLNQTIRDFAAGSDAGIEVVDLATAAARASPDGIVGDELLYEHVHLNLAGTHLVARELFARVAADLVRRKLAPASPLDREPLALSEVRRRLAYTTYEQAMIIKELQERFAGAPFTGQSDNAERRRLYAQRDEVATRMLAQTETRDAVVAFYTEALGASPGDWMLERNAGMALVALGLPERGREHLARAAAIMPDDPDTLFALGTAQRVLGEVAVAEKSFATLRELEPRYPGLPDR